MVRLVPLMALLACGGGSDSGSALPAGGTPEPGLDLDLPTVCSPFLPVDLEGRVLTYEGVDDDGVSSRWTFAPAGKRALPLDSGKAWRVDAEGTAEGFYNERDEWSSQSWYRCDEEGVWQVGYTYTIESFDASGGSGPSTFTYEYFREPLLVPNELEEGDSWESWSELRFELNGSSSPVFEERDTYEVVEFVSKSVPAGTFDSVKTKGPTQAGWWVSGLGQIALGTNKLVEVSGP